MKSTPIKPNIGDIILNNKFGIYYRTLMYCKHSETQDTMVVYESLETKRVVATPLTKFTNDKFTIVIKAEDLES